MTDWLPRRSPLLLTNPPLTNVHVQSIAQTDRHSPQHYITTRSLQESCNPKGPLHQNSGAQGELPTLLTSRAQKLIFLSHIVSYTFQSTISWARYGELGAGGSEAEAMAVLSHIHIASSSSRWASQLRHSGSPGLAVAQCSQLAFQPPQQ